MGGKSTRNNETVIVIGSGVAGMNVIYNLLKTKKRMNMMCITREDQVAYSTCGLPYALEGITKKGNVTKKGNKRYQKW